MFKHKRQTKRILKAIIIYNKLFYDHILLEDHQNVTKKVRWKRLKQEKNTSRCQKQTSLLFSHPLTALPS